MIHGTADNTESDPTRAKPRRLGRAIAFRLAAVAVGLAPFLAAELVLRLAGIEPAPAPDPFVTFSRTDPLFVPDTGQSSDTADSFRRYVTNPEKLTWFRSQSFVMPKPPNTFRIFCLGGSTMQGRPYSVETAFPTWLQLALQTARPATRWEVINCGGVSYASYRLVPILEEVLDYDPDMVILCTGHNEFLEDRSYGRVKHMPRPVAWLHRTCMHLRLYRIAYAAVQRRSVDTGPERHQLPADVRARLDFENGLERYHHDDAWQAGVVEHFAVALDRMARIARHRDVPILLVSPAANLKDCPPFKSEFAAETTPAERQTIANLLARADRLGWSDPFARLDLLRRAAAIDNHHAGLCFRLGTCYLRIGRTAEARRWFIRAKDEDICPLRILKPMRQAIHDTARRYDIPLVDAQVLFERATDDGICGSQWLLDHVHPTVEGHQRIAEVLFERMCENGWVDRPIDWDVCKRALWDQHLAGINDAYWLHGAQRLERLRYWTGRARPPVEAQPQGSSAADPNR